MTIARKTFIIIMAGKHIHAHEWRGEYEIYNYTDNFYLRNIVYLREEADWGKYECTKVLVIIKRNPFAP